MDFRVTEQDAGERLDVVLVRRVPGMSRARARRSIGDGHVTVNGRPAKKGVAVRSGDRVELQEAPEPSDFRAAPDPRGALRIAHEDARVVVVDKDAGVPSHPLRPREEGTVAGALVARYPEMADVGYSPREPGLVHRLDTDTSGLLVAARDTEAFESLVRALREGRWDKRYVALVAGRIGAPRIIDFPIASDRRDPKRVTVCRDPGQARRLGARPAETELMEARPVGSMTQVWLRARTARRHQVRAHLAALGHPLAGDALYGGPPLPGLDRHFLHACQLAVPHPDGGELGVDSDLAPDLWRVLDTAGSGYN